jgi:hypothetical protein
MFLTVCNKDQHVSVTVTVTVCGQLNSNSQFLRLCAPSLTGMTPRSHSTVPKRKSSEEPTCRPPPEPSHHAGRTTSAGAPWRCVRSGWPENAHVFLEKYIYRTFSPQLCVTLVLTAAALGTLFQTYLNITGKRRNISTTDSLRSHPGCKQHSTHTHTHTHTHTLS